MTDPQSTETDDNRHDKHTDHDHGHNHDHDKNHNHAHHEHDENHTHHDHAHHEHDLSTVGFAVLTVTSSRTLDDDPAGDAIAAILEDAGHEVITRDLIPDDYDRVQSTADALVNRGDVDAVVTTGGTGVTPDDVTIEAIQPLFEKELPGFGELFRTLSRDEIGTRVIATRATAGVADGVPVFCLPGSENAVALGTTEIVAPQVGHLAGLASRHEDEDEE